MPYHLAYPFLPSASSSLPSAWWASPSDRRKPTRPTLVYRHLADSWPHTIRTFLESLRERKRKQTVSKKGRNVKKRKGRAWYVKQNFFACLSVSFPSVSFSISISFFKSFVCLSPFHSFSFTLAMDVTRGSKASVPTLELCSLPSSDRDG